jgi:bifunctional ADP-heptose synthase (sugar kinase/adenylyltransferase)
MTPDRLQSILTQFPRLNIGLVGDLFLDRYLDIEPGVHELSIETALEAYQVSRVRNYPGALGTVINNLTALGVGNLVAMTVIGDDGHGYDLLQAMQSLPVDTTPIVRDSQRLTPTYTKPMKRDAGGIAQELNRIDVRTRASLSDQSHARLAENVRDVFQRVDGLIVLDQVVEEDWGVVDRRLRDLLRELAASHPQKLMYVDSRAFLGKFDYGILKGNRSEFLRTADLSFEADSCDDAGLHHALAAMANRNGRPMFCSAGERGILVARPGEMPCLVPGYAVPPPIDICGAGDAASSGIVASLLTGASELEAATVGNLVASITVQQLGVTGTATPEQVRERHKLMSHHQ